MDYLKALSEMPVSKTSANLAKASWQTVSEIVSFHHLSTDPKSSIFLTLYLIYSSFYLARWERKGKLKKKNLDSDDFKERYFELVRDNLYYYKSERTKE